MKKNNKIIVFVLIFFYLTSVFPKVLISNDFEGVVVKGASFRSLVGKQLRELRLFAIINNKITSIPFQWDEIDSEGKYIYNNFPGTLSVNDELVFLFNDAGNKVSEKDSKSFLYEIKVKNYAGEERFVYLSTKELINISLNSDDFVSISSSHREIKGKNYIVKFFNDYQSIPGEYIFVTKDGKRINFMDKVKLDVKLKFFRFFKMNINEKSFVTKFLGSKDGPVRVLMGIKNSTKVVFNIPAFPVYFDVKFYPEYAVFPITIDLPLKPDSLIINLENDFNNLYGWKLYTSCHNKNPFIINGIPDDEERFHCSWWKWYSLSGKNMAFWMLGFFPTNFPVNMDLYLNDNKNFATKNERYLGEVPGIGWHFESYGSVKKDIKHISFKIYILFTKPYRYGDEKEILGSILHPVKYFVNKLQ